MTPATAEMTTIHVDGDVREAIAKIQQEIEDETGRAATTNDALWRLLNLRKTAEHPYEDKPRLKAAFEAGYHTRVVGEARQRNPYAAPREPGTPSPYRRAWFEGWDLADERSKGHLIEEPTT